MPIYVLTYLFCIAGIMPKKKSLSKRLLHRFEYISLRGLAVLFAFLPLSVVYRIAGLLGLICCDVLKIRYDVTIENLRRAFAPERDERELHRLAKESYRQIGMTFIEMLLVPRLKARMLEIVDVSGLEDLSYRPGDKRGIIFVSAHFGSWELNGASLALSGIPMTTVAKRQSNPYVDGYITRQRTDLGLNIVQPGASVKQLVQALKNGEGIGLISDQDAGARGVFVDFFGEKASTPVGAAQLALKYGAPLVVSMTRRLEAGRYQSIFREVALEEGDSAESVTQRFTAVMEDIIRETPEQYFWMHRRWKTKADRVAGESSRGSGSGQETS